MLISEFIERTGFRPTDEEYRRIEDAYYQFDGDKDAFCKDFVMTGGERKIYEARNAEIAQLRSQLAEMEKLFKADIKKQEQKIVSLQERLDRELEWKPSEKTGTNMRQGDYEALAALCDGTHGDPHVMTDDEAKQVIFEEFGFDINRITIVRSVNTYDVNRHGELRIAGEYERAPLYDVSDYNYIRFDVNCPGIRWCYEMVNGELQQYNC